MLYNYIHSGANTIQFFFGGIWINSTFYLIHDGYSKTRLLTVSRTIIAVRSTIIQWRFWLLENGVEGVGRAIMYPAESHTSVENVRWWGSCELFFYRQVYIYMYQNPTSLQRDNMSKLNYVCILFFGIDLWYAAVYMCIIGSTDNVTYVIEYTIPHKRNKGCPFFTGCFILQPELSS